MTTVEEPDAAAAPVDLLLAASAQGPLRRLTPGGPATRLAAGLARRPGTVVRHGRSLAGEYGRILTGRSEVAPHKRDRRFADEAWQDNAALRRILQGYLVTAATAQDVLGEVDLDWRDRERLQFAVDNLIAAAAPSNNPVLSPVAWKAAKQTRGRSVVRGVRNLVDDLSAAPRVPTMVRPDAFEVGKDLALTPGAVVLRTETFELIQYTPQTPTVRTRPLLFIPPVINKFYIADLAPGRSLVEFLVQGGQQVFMISWRNPDVRHKDWDLDHYGAAILKALDAALAITGADTATVLGCCSGGTLQSMALAALAADDRLQEKVAGFALAVCVLDQAKAGTAGALIDEPTVKAAAAASSAKGYLDGRSLAEIFAWLRPDDLIWNYWVNNYLAGRDPAAFDILSWNADTTRMAVGLHHGFLGIAKDNSLVSPGAARMLDRPVDLSRIDVDGYVVAGVADHISPWQNCYRSAALFGGKTRFVLSTSGHIAAIVNPPGGKSTHQVSEDLDTGADDWAKRTPMTSGSWWPDYLAWLTDRTGPERDAPTALGGPGFVAGDAAPGRYVLDR